MICTSIEQTKKLLDIGIDINTADLTIINLPLENEERFNFISSRIPNDIFPSITDGKSERVPAWSLDALMELIPYEIVLDDDESLVLGIHKEDIQYYLEYSSTYSGEIFFDTLMHDDFIDAAFEMVCWLKENKYI